MKGTGYFLGIGLVLALLLAGGFYYLRGRGAVAPVSSLGTSTPATASSTVTAGGVTITAPNGEKIEAVPVETITPPSLSGKIYIASEIPPEAQAQLRKNIETLIADIKADPANLGYWLDLGNNRRIAKDYTGAVEAWEYVTKAAPSDYTAFNNLGDLYMSVLKDYPKAEANFKQAIAVSPQTGDLYRNLYTLYLYYYKTDTSAARDILTLGIKNNPQNGDLKGLLAEYNKTHVQ